MKTVDWQELAMLTRGAAFIVERVRIPATGIAIEGAFELPVLAQLSSDDQVFVMAFVRAEGIIKEMERVYGVSYPTIKGRLSRIANQLQLIETVPSTQRQETLGALERGEITAQEAIERLSR